MARLGVTESVDFFTGDALAHIERGDGKFTFKGLCGQELHYCRPETEIKEANAKYHQTQKMCKRCLKRRERGES